VGHNRPMKFDGHSTGNLNKLHKDKIEKETRSFRQEKMEQFLKTYQTKNLMEVMRMKDSEIKLRNETEKMAGEFEKVLPTNIPVQRFLRVLQSSIFNSDTLMKADRKSLYSACIESASDGLLPDGKEAALIPYKGMVSYVPMVTGLIKKIYSVPGVKSVVSNVVYSNDEFDYQVDERGEHIRHSTDMFADRGDPAGAYAMVVFDGGTCTFEYMSAKEILAIKEKVTSKLSPWYGPHELEMWKKSTIRRLSKRLPINVFDFNPSLDVATGEIHDTSTVAAVENAGDL